MKKELLESLERFYKNTKEYVNKYNEYYENFNVEDLIQTYYIETLLIENDFYSSLRYYASNNNISLHEMALDIDSIYKDIDFNTNIYKLMDCLEQVLDYANEYEIDLNDYDLSKVYDEIPEYLWG